jgi:hypothetical protein
MAQCMSVYETEEWEVPVCSFCSAGPPKRATGLAPAAAEMRLELPDAQGRKLGTATHLQQVMEPGARWQFKALVMAGEAVWPPVTSIAGQP